MIHYHGTPLSGDRSTQIRALRGKHAMVSFAEQSPMEVVSEVCQSFCIDNGAFTAWKKGGELDLEGYARFVAEWMTHPRFDFYVIPDVIDGDECDNLAMMAKWREESPRHDMLTLGAPVWHMHEPLSVLSEFCHAFFRVCIGSSGEYAEVGTGRWWGRMAEAMSVACGEDGRPRAKLHGLRMLDPMVFSRLPLSSADSTNVARNIGIDSAWRGTYQPSNRETRALVMMERIEANTSASDWHTPGIQEALL